MKIAASKTPSVKTAALPQKAAPTRAPHETDILAGIRVKLRRKEIGFSQTDLGNRLGITFQQVQKYEKGTNRMSASRLEATAKVLAVPISYFFLDPTSSESPEAQAEAAFAAVQTGSLLKDFAGVGSPAVRKAVRDLVDALAEA